MFGLLVGYSIVFGVYGVYYGDNKNVCDYGNNFLLGVMSGFVVPIGICELLYYKYTTPIKNK
jgi:hypothetical protein